MNKRLTTITVVLLALLLSACGAQPSWEKEKVSVASTRILSDDVKASWTIDDQSRSSANDKGGQKIRIEITKKDGGRIKEFDINHEKLLHLIIVSKDLSYFNHIHPEYKGDGVFEIENEFPAGGEYRLIADFKPANGDSMTRMEWMTVKGERAIPIPVVTDDSLEKTFDGKKVKLAVGELAAKKETELAFTIIDEKTGEPITNLEPYLGAIGHVVILTEDGEKYVHVHAEEGQGTGPIASFETTFPKSGVYKIWGQFQQNMTYALRSTNW